MKSSIKRIYIAPCLNDAINCEMEKYILFLLNFFKNKIDVSVISCSRQEVKISDVEILSLCDTPHLFDLSRYSSIINYIEKDSIVFMFNDTLGCGRKFNFPLKLFILFSILVLLYSSTKNMSAPTDSNNHGRWVCPYFIVGHSTFLQCLNFTDWRCSSRNLSKTEKKLLVSWLSTNWRSRNVVDNKGFKTKYKTLLIEKNIISSAAISKYVIEFNRMSLSRMLNSFFPF